MTCPSCGVDNREGRKFCAHCGKPLSLVCPTCGAGNEPGDRFCGECGAPLGPNANAGAGVAADPAATPVAERRLVSVLFADLVGFTSLSESRDAEDTREFLSRYFGTCRRLIALYGGTVEKFIGDAVMAVWGSPVATEDDAERAVRAALDLVAAVSALGDEVGAAELRARAGVLTGEAAVNLGAEGEGMVVGDLVNTASRVQSIAQPGTVLVGEATRRATEQAIAFESAGSHEVRGKSGLVPLWQALRVVSGARGALKAEGLEAPFVGRDPELRLLKDQFHATAEERKARLVSVTGIAGVGKSRLAWEFYKYIDGLPAVTYWHRGRCLAYGEGVTYWALADMVRFRCRIAEDEEPAAALAKLRATLAEHVRDEDERRFVEPRLAHLLGLEEREAREKEELFGAWRLFFERLSDTNPTVLVFEDMQWADDSLLDFVEYLLEWSRGHPLFVLTLARPELAERRPTWGATSRMFTTLYLEPLSEEAIRELLHGLVPGLPDELIASILARAEGVPLYAVETVRMLFDRGLVVQEGSAYRPVGPIETLDVPETLHALIAARLDGLSPDERRVLQDGAVLGKTFTRRGLAAVSGFDEARLERLLTGLVRKEVLSIQADPRSPEHGQYGFLQDLVRHVAYETLSRRERKVRHLAAAAHLEQAFGAEQEVVEVLAAHYIAAYEAERDGGDAGEIKRRAVSLLGRAGERAGSLAATAEARRYFEQAAALAEEPIERAGLLERAGEMAFRTGESEQAQDILEQATTLFADAGDEYQAARVAARLGEVEWRLGRLDDAVEQMERAYAQIAAGDPNPDLVALAAELGRLHIFRGEPELATARLETALEFAEALWLPELVASVLISKGQLAKMRSRLEEAEALTRGALTLSQEHGVSAGPRVFMNLADILGYRDRSDEVAATLRQGLSLARRIGHSFWEASLLGELSWPLALTGQWDEALGCFEQLPEGELGLGTFILALPEVMIARGRLEDAECLLALYDRYESGDIQERLLWKAGQTVVLRAERKNAEALAAGEETVVAAMEHLGTASQPVKVAFPQAVEAALELAERTRAEELLARIDGLPPGWLAPMLRAHSLRFRARLAATDGNGEKARAGYTASAGTFREFGMPFLLAVTLLEHGEWLVGLGRSDEAAALVAEALATFEQLGANPWIERASGVADGALPARSAAAAP